MFNLRKWRKRQRKIGLILAILLIFAILLGTFLPFIVYGEEKNPITIIGEVGFNNKYRINGTTPIHLEITNEGEDFVGEVQVKVLREKFNNIMNYMLYAQDINLPKGSTKKVTLNIHPISLQRTFKVSLLSNSKEVVKKTLYATPFEPERGFIGVLSEDVESLNYLKNLRLNSGRDVSVGNRLIELDVNSFPTDINLLDNFEVIVINNFDTSKLNDEQTENLKRWVMTGGILILGTGTNTSKVLRGFDEDFISIKDKGIVKTNDFSQMEELGGYSMEEKSLDISDLQVDNGKGVLFSNNLPITTLVAKNEGSILIHHFDIGLNPFGGWSGNAYMLTELYMSSVPNFFLKMDQIGDKDSYNNVYALRLFPRPQQDYLLILVLLIVGIYIFIAGPILYLILKINDKREYGWFIIPIIGIFFTAVILLISNNAIYRNPVASSVGIASLREGETLGTVDISLGLFTPKNGENEIEIQQDINPEISSNYDYPINTMNNSVKMKERVSVKVNKGDKNRFIFYNNQSWAMNIFNGTSNFNVSGPIESSLVFKDNKIVGTIKNNLGFDLEQSILAVGDSYYYIGNIKNNDTINTDQVISFNSKNRYEAIDDIFGETYNKKDMLKKWGKDIKQEELQRIIQRRSIYEAYVNRSFKTMQSTSQYPKQEKFKDNSIILYGFNEQNYFGDIKVNNRLVKGYEQNLLVIPLELDYSKMDTIEIPYGFIKPYITGNTGYHIDEYDNSIYVNNSGKFDLNFNVPLDINISEFQVQFMRTPIIEQALIYNNSSDKWEELSDLIYTDNVSDYINDAGVILTRFNIIFDDDGDNRLEIPKFRLKGDQ